MLAALLERRLFAVFVSGDLLVKGLLLVTGAVVVTA